MLQIYALLLIVNLSIPTIAIHFTQVSADDAVCAIFEDFSEEEEDSESEKDTADPLFFREWVSNNLLTHQRTSTSDSSYPNNNAYPHTIDLEVQTPPPKHTMC